VSTHSSNTPLVAPSLLAADFSRLELEIEMLNNSDADWIHIDVMDGHFVPNIAIGFPVLEVLKKYATKPLDVHLMIEKPERYIRRFKDHGANRLIIHQEACLHLDRTLGEIRKMNLGVGVAINPSTPVSMLEDVLHLVDQVCIMSVNPGFGGQRFIPHSLKKISVLKEMILQQSLSVRIQIDGGVDKDNIAQLKAAGVDIFVAGSYIFEADDPAAVIRSIKEMNTRSGMKWI